MKPLVANVIMLPAIGLIYSKRRNPEAEFIKVAFNYFG
jgi:hypothetical protein